jgi:hypothetical protein
MHMLPMFAWSAWDAALLVATTDVRLESLTYSHLSIRTFSSTTPNSPVSRALKAEIIS